MAHIETSAGNLGLILNEDYICAACSCGRASLIPIRYAVDQGVITCHCGANINIDSALIEQLTREEKLRLTRRVLNQTQVTAAKVQPAAPSPGTPIRVDGS